MRQNQSLFPYTSQQLLSLADNEHFARSSRGIALPYRWLSLGQSEDAFWGEYPQKDKDNIRTQIHLADMQMSCNCGSKTFPCHHALALVLMFQEEALDFERVSVPDWVKAKLPGLRQANRPNENPRLDSFQIKGLEALETWLFDLIYLGLEQARHYPFAFWYEMANHLVDARLGSLAEDLKTWGQGVTKDDWSRELLAKMGKLHILLEAFKRFDTLDKPVQADLLQVLGIKPAFEAEPIEDNWLVIGRAKLQTGNRKLERIWLKSLTTGQLAGLEKALLKPELSDTQLLTGLSLNASVHYYATSVPLYADLFGAYKLKHKVGKLEGESSIKTSLEKVAKAKAKNPWLIVFPLHLSEVSLVSLESDWALVDKDGYHLTLPKRTIGRWQMRAKAYESGLSVFGEYRSGQYFPLAMETAQGWIDLSVLRGGSL